MTQIQWQQLETMIDAMTPEDKHRLTAMLTEKPAAKEQNGSQASKPSPAPPIRDPSNSWFGAFSDEPELIDEVMRYVYQSRENDPLRAGD